MYRELGLSAKGRPVPCPPMSPSPESAEKIVVRNVYVPATVTGLLGQSGHWGLACWAESQLDVLEELLLRGLVVVRAMERP